MRSIETRGRVTKDGMLTLPAPRGTPPGEHPVVVVVDDQVLKPSQGVARELPVLHCGGWPEGISLSREDLYDDTGR
jgi:hypothetical protein